MKRINIVKRSAVCLAAAVTGILLITGCGGKAENTADSVQTSQKEESQTDDTQNEGDQIQWSVKKQSEPHADKRKTAENALHDHGQQ